MGAQARDAIVSQSLRATARLDPLQAVEKRLDGARPTARPMSGFCSFKHLLCGAPPMNPEARCAKQPLQQPASRRRVIRWMNAFFAAGTTSRKVSPNPRSQRSGARSLEKPSTSRSVSAMVPSRSSCAAAVARDERRRTDRGRIGDDELRELPCIAQPEVQSLPGNRVQGLGSACPAARRALVRGPAMRSASGYVACAVHRVKRPARAPKAAAARAGMPHRPGRRGATPDPASWSTPARSLRPQQQRDHPWA